MSAERTLWLCVLGEQLNLALREKDPFYGQLHTDACTVARRWIGSRDFREVCVLAGLNHEWVERIITEQLALPVADRHLSLVGLRSVSSGIENVRAPRARHHEEVAA